MATFSVSQNVSKTQVLNIRIGRRYGYRICSGRVGRSLTILSSVDWLALRLSAWRLSQNLDTCISTALFA